MSTAPEELEPDNVVSMKEALVATHRQIAAADEFLHRFLHQLESRIHAFDLAEDPTFDEEWREARKSLFKE